MKPNELFSPVVFVPQKLDRVIWNVYVLLTKVMMVLDHLVLSLLIPILMIEIDV